MQRHRLGSNFWSGLGQTTAQGLGWVRVDPSQEQFCVLSLAGGSQTRIHGDMRLCAWEGVGANERLAAVTSRNTICFIWGSCTTARSNRLASRRTTSNRGKSPFHAQSCQSQCATVQRIGAPYLPTSRKTMHRPNDRYSVDGGTAATLLGADHMRQSQRPDRSRRIYFRSPWYRAIGVA